MKKYLFSLVTLLVMLTISGCNIEPQVEQVVEQKTQEKFQDLENKLDKKLADVEAQKKEELQELQKKV